MKIDLTHEPPVDIFRDRGKYLRISIALLSLVVCGVLLMVYGVVSDTPHSETLESAALTLFVVPAMIFVYFGGKLKDYKRLAPEQKKELVELGRKHPEIATYCCLVAKQGREPIFAEYETCREWVENLTHKLERPERLKKK